MADKPSADGSDPPRGGSSSPLPDSLVATGQTMAGTVDLGSGGFMYIPQEEIGVDVMSPQKVVWYRVLEESVNRLKDAIRESEADRRLECLFGFGGLSLGTARDAYFVLEAMANEKVPSFIDLGLTMVFFVSVSFCFYFWKFAKKRGESAEDMLSKIFRKEGGDDGAGAVP